jgi:hypothetical protein
MVLVMARREAGPHEGWPKALKGESENSSRKQRDLLNKRHNDSLLTFSQGIMKKVDDD